MNAILMVQLRRQAVGELVSRFGDGCALIRQTFQEYYETGSTDEALLRYLREVAEKRNGAIWIADAYGQIAIELNYDDAYVGYESYARQNQKELAERIGTGDMVYTAYAGDGLYYSPVITVGCAIQKDGAVIGQGWHERYGEPHAERNALAACAADPTGATMYVTLEPCCHHGKQPPCVEAILASGIRRVVIGSADPNPLVAGKGVAILRSHGVEVTENVLREECDALNRIFFHYITIGWPFVSMKYAMTMDGKIAAYTGASKWVTGETARSHVQQQRHRFRGIMVGVGTVLADDPLLTCRMENGRNPVRIICDTHLRTPPQAQVVTTAEQIPTILATCCADPERQAVYQRAGCQVLCLNEENGHVDLRQLMERLGWEQIDSILLEGGGTLNWAALECGIVQQVQAYIAPKLFGGRDAKTPVEGVGVPAPTNAFRLKNSRLERLGEDLLIESEVEYPCSQES